MVDLQIPTQAEYEARQVALAKGLAHTLYLQLVQFCSLNPDFDLSGLEVGLEGFIVATAPVAKVAGVTKRDWLKAIADRLAKHTGKVIVT